MYSTHEDTNSVDTSFSFSLQVSTAKSKESRITQNWSDYSRASLALLPARWINQSDRSQRFSYKISTILIHFVTVLTDRRLAAPGVSTRLGLIDLLYSTAIRTRGDVRTKEVFGDLTPLFEIIAGILYFYVFYYTLQRHKLQPIQVGILFYTMIYTINSMIPADGWMKGSMIPQRLRPKQETAYASAYAPTVCRLTTRHKNS